MWAFIRLIGAAGLYGLCGLWVIHIIYCARAFLESGKQGLLEFLTAPHLLGPGLTAAQRLSLRSVAVAEVVWAVLTVLAWFSARALSRSVLRCAKNTNEA